MSKHPADSVSALPDCPDDSHKGACGRLLVIAGSSQFSGAAHGSVEGTLRGGTGGVLAMGVPSMSVLIEHHIPTVVDADAILPVYDIIQGVTA